MGGTKRMDTEEISELVDRIFTEEPAHKTPGFQKLTGKKYPGIANHGLDLTSEDIPIGVCLEIEALQIDGTIPRHVKGAVMQVRVPGEPVRHGYSRYAIELLLSKGTASQKEAATWLRAHVEKSVTIYLLTAPMKVPATFIND